MTHSRRLKLLLRLETEVRLAELAVLNAAERRELRWHWRLWARRDQLPPPGDWRIWLIMAGRGFGKTRAGAEWVRTIAEADPAARIALVASSLGEARAVMVEGESGILAVSPPDRCPAFESSLRRLVWPSGAQATLFSAGEPESLRGPQHSHAYRACSERGLRQRGTCPDGRSDPLRHRRHSYRTAGNPGGGHELAVGHLSHRRLGRTGRQDRLPSGWKLAVHHTEGRHAAARQVKRAGTALFRRLAGP